MALVCLAVPLAAQVEGEADHQSAPVGHVAAVDEEGLTACDPTTTPLTLDGGYEVRMCYETPDGTIGEARGGVWTSGESGLLWFFNRDNVEVLIKVLDGCAINGHYWVFVAPVTDLAFNLHVTSSDGRRWTQRNRQGEPAEAMSDTSAFVCSADVGGTR